jgi:hypothetical protein
MSKAKSGIAAVAQRISTKLSREGTSSRPGFRFAHPGYALVEFDADRLDECANYANSPLAISSIALR